MSEKKLGFMVEARLKGKWEIMSDWNKAIVGWTPAVYERKSKAERLAEKLRKRGTVTGVSEGKIIREKIPIRIRPVLFTISGEVGRREFDIKLLPKDMRKMLKGVL